ncbi:MAG TPA: FHA domain-containing protein [Acidimicrobiales bacterium]|nr:FHA domain-containing protein [Acidimicrobiales bacterium]
MVLSVALDNQNLLRALEVIVVALIWLFFFRVIRAVWVEIRPPKSMGVAEVQAGGAPASRRERKSLRLKVVEPEDQRGNVFDLGDELTIGRAAGCGVRVDDSYTSALHARLFKRDDTMWVEDLSSTNGTWVNAERIATATRLGRGDLLQVGGTVFEVSR